MTDVPSPGTVPLQRLSSSPEGDWIFPVRDAAITARAALIASSALSGLVLLSLLCVVGLVLGFLVTGSVLPWAPLALLPLAAACMIVWRRSPLTVSCTVALILACIASFIFLTVIAAQSPTQAPAGTAGFLLSMTKMIMVFIGMGADRWTGGIAGTISGYFLAEVTVVLTAAVVGLPFSFDGPPYAVAAGVTFGHLLFPLARARARQGTESLEQADRRSRSRRLRELEGRESIVQLHDTLLNELAALAARQPGPLSAAETARLQRSLESSAMLPLLREEEVPRDEGMGGWLRTIGEAGGVHITLEGEVAALDELPPSTAGPLRAALEQCIVNITRHAEVTEAWIVVSVLDAELGVTVVDEGVGFDLQSVAPDRLGLSESVRGRIQRSGGSVQVWIGRAHV